MMKLLGADKLCRDRILWWVMLVVIPFLISGCTGGGGSQVYSIAGHVVSSDGSGLSGLPVTAGSFSTVTDQNGNFTFTGIKGTVLVLVENPHSLVVPTFRTVSSTTNSATFTVHSLLATGSDVEIPDHGFAAFESGIILDFRQTLLAGDGMVSVHIVDSPQDCAGMDIAGAVVDIDISEPLGVDESVELSILPDSGTSIEDQDLGIFHKDEDLNVWNHILSSLEDGYVRSSVRNFSQYGLFSAPITDTPAATPQSGTWAANTVVSMSATENAVIYYTTDGSDPTLESAVYVDQPLIVGDGLEVRAIAVEPNHRVSTVAVFSYSEAVPEPSSALRFGTISGHGSYFDFDSGSMTTDSYTGDIRLSALSIIGGEYQQHLQEYKGNYFPRPGEADQWNLPFSRFQDLTEEDWEDDPHDQTGSGWVYPGDTLLIETTAGKFVKMVILQERIQAGVGDAPAIDFLYVYDQDSDTQAPTLLTVSLETQDGTVFTVPVTETISFSVDSEPRLLFFEFDEEVYPHRYLHSYDDGTARSEIRFETELGWTQMPAAKTLRAPVYWTGGDEITIKEAPNYNGMPIDHGYFFSDVSGNALFQLPFEEIVIQMLE